MYSLPSSIVYTNLHWYSSLYFVLVLVMVVLRSFSSTSLHDSAYYCNSSQYRSVLVRPSRLRSASGVRPVARAPGRLKVVNTRTRRERAEVRVHEHVCVL